MAKAKDPAHQPDGELLHRAGTIEVRAAAEGEADTRTADISFSSEIRADRWFGGEILDHTAGAARMEFLNGGRAPLLMHHDGRQVIGVVTKASIDADKKGRATVRFSRSPAGEAALADVRDGILSNVSVGYRVHDMKLDQKGDDGETYRVTDWEPLEVSLVSIPVDPTVGVGRSEAIDGLVIRARSASTLYLTRGITMTPEEIAAKAAADKAAADRAAAETATRSAELSGASAAAATAERGRIKEIRDLAGRHNLGAIGDEHIEKGTEIALFKGIMLEEIGKRGSSKPLSEMPGDLKLGDKDKKRYSLTRAIAMLADSIERKTTISTFERELSDEIAKRGDKDARGLFIPYDVMLQREVETDSPSMFKRVLTASGGVATGGAVVQSTVLAGQYIPPNYNIPVVVAAGAKVLSGLTGNVLIPKMTAGKSGTWVTPENTAVTAADATFAQVSLSPKDFGTVADISRRLLLQANPAIDGLVRDDIAEAIRLGIDAAALIGTGASGQPTGVTGQAGVATVAGGTNGLALSWANATYLPQNVAVANRLKMGPDVGFITNGQTFFHAARTPKVAGYPVFIAETPQNGMNQLGANAGTILNMPVHISQQAPGTLTKGTGINLSAMYFGVWSDLLIGEWGMMDLLVDPYTFSNTGAIRIRCFVTIDVAVRYGQSFAQIVDIITT